MTAYRDQYASLFNEGRNVVVVGISNDSPEELGSWLKDEDFPFLFLSDAEHRGRHLRGVRRRKARQQHGRQPLGHCRRSGRNRIAGVIPQFAQVDPTAYEELAAMVDAATPEP